MITHTLTKAPLSLIVWLLAVSLWLMWAPFEQRLHAVKWQLYPSVDLQTGLHFFLFIPLAMVLTTHTAGTTARRPLVRVWGAVVLLNVLLELGQGWISGRFLSPHDVGVGASGAAVAVWGTAHLLRRGLEPRTLLVAVSVGMFIALHGGYVASSTWLKQGFTLTAWEPFGVQAGDEVDGERPYQGVIWHAQVCAGEAPTQMCMTAGAETPTRRALIERAEHAQVVELSATVWSSTARQWGPARIITFSQNARLRNATLAQRGQDLVFRVRTPRSGPNGTRPEFVLRHAIPTAVPTRVVARFARGAVILQAEHSGQTTTATWRPDLLQSTVQTHGASNIPVIFQGRAALVGVGLVFMSLGLATGWLLPTRWCMALWVGPALAAFYLWGMDTWWLETLPPGRDEYLLAIGATALGVGLAVWDWYRGQERRGLASLHCHNRR